MVSHASEMWALFPGAIALLGSVFLLIIRNRTKKAVTAPPNISLEKQSIPVKGEPRGLQEWPVTVRRPTGFGEHLSRSADPVGSIQQRTQDGPCVGTRGSDGQYRFRKYSEVRMDSTSFASAIVGELNMKPGDRIGIYAQNRAEWLITALGCVQQSIIIVPLYDTLGADAASFIVSQAEISVVVVDSQLKAQNLASKKTLMPTLTDIVIMDKEGVTEEFIEEMKTVGIRITFMKDIIERGSQNPQPRHLPTKDDIYIICYTSGTTGTPKGVIITHACILANVSGWIFAVNKFLPDMISPNLVRFSHPPEELLTEMVPSMRVKSSVRFRVT
ncbi:hypothetical protein COOONC_04749 [Cooperia oncophora]